MNSPYSTSPTTMGLKQWKIEYSLSRNQLALIDVVINSNDEPKVDTELPILLAHIQRLKDEFHRCTNRQYSSDISPDTVPKRARKYCDGIRKHLACLSPVRSVPAELWIHIATLSQDDLYSHDSSTSFPTLLQRLSGVSRWIRSSIIHDRTLWACLPPMRIQPSDMKQLPRLIEIVKMYISRSGTVPLSWSLHLNSTVWATSRPFVLELLRVLMEQCHRWRSIHLAVPLSLYHFLSPIRDQLPVLSSLRLDLTSIVDGVSATLGVIRTFEDAPALRKVEVMTGRPIRVSLPWSQLEEVTIKARDDSVYHTLLDTQSSQLRSLELTRSSSHHEQWSNQASIHPSFNDKLSTLPGLTKLSLHTTVGRQHEGFRLESLVLPDLLDLEIDGSGSPEALFNAVAALLVRSRCSLKRLALLSHSPDVEETSGSCDGLTTSMSSILSMSPYLEHLELKTFPLGVIDQLITTPTGPASVSLSLKTLILHCDRLGNADLELLLSKFASLAGTQVSRLEEVGLVFIQGGKAYEAAYSMEAFNERSVDKSTQYRWRVLPKRRMDPVRSQLVVLSWEALPHRRPH